MESGFSKDISGILNHFQKNEITEHLIYEKLAEKEKDPHNKEVLGRSAGDELKHYNIIKKLQGRSFRRTKEEYSGLLQWQGSSDLPLRSN
ncbi:hypothetical protein [Methanolacinia petrolearia]|uniref:hypothetical protein n=1 Tax=Methanolacinia petrolearia TaxID=54120 RepID=UPI003BA916FE